MPITASYIVSALNNRAGLSLEIVIPQEHTCVTRQHPQVICQNCSQPFLCMLAFQKHCIRLEKTWTVVALGGVKTSEVIETAFSVLCFCFNEV